MSPQSKDARRSNRIERPSSAAPWYGLGSTVCGVSHRRQGRPCQDALDWSPRRSGGSASLAIAVADGHGSPAHPRSDTGAAFAVQAAISALRDLECMGDTRAERRACSGLAEQIVERWRASVLRQLLERPLATAEMISGGAGDGIVAYGSTLVAALVTPARLICVQIGDGDILLVSADGHVRRPWPRDERFLASYTTSLCSPDPVAEFRLHEESFSAQAPQLILLATDGYANSFRSDEDFVRVGPDILAAVRESGIDHVAGALPGWLAESTIGGSGDDVTVGLIYRETENFSQEGPGSSI